MQFFFTEKFDRFQIQNCKNRRLQHATTTIRVHIQEREKDRRRGGGGNHDLYIII